MNNIKPNSYKYQHISVEERETIAIYLEKNMTLPEIAEELKRHRTTIYREVLRNSPQIYCKPYRSQYAHNHAVGKFPSKKEDWKRCYTTIHY